MTSANSKRGAGSPSLIHEHAHPGEVTGSGDPFQQPSVDSLQPLRNSTRRTGGDCTEVTMIDSWQPILRAILYLAISRSRESPIRVDPYTDTCTISSWYLIDVRYDAMVICGMSQAANNDAKPRLQHELTPQNIRKDDIVQLDHRSTQL